MNFGENILKRRPGINCSDKALQYDEMNDKTKESLCVAWMKVILNDNTTWNNRFEYEKWINKQFGLNLFNEFKKLIGVNVVCKNDNSNNLPEKFLCSLNRLTNEVIIFEKGSDIDLLKFRLSNLKEATLVFEKLNVICDKLNELFYSKKKVSEAYYEICNEKMGLEEIINDLEKTSDNKQKHIVTLEKKIHRMRKAIHELEDLASHRNAVLLRENTQLKKKIKSLEDANDGLIEIIAHFDIKELEE